MLKRARDDDGDDDEPEITYKSQTIVCNLGTCELNPQYFDLYLRYEGHITSNHSYICQECFHRFPNKWFLELHIDENHNPFNKIIQEKGGKIFKCFLYNNGCQKICSTPKKRRLHMIDKHSYPQNYNWNIINKGI